jgi:hypothetical protein
VPEVDTGFEHLPHGDDGHGFSFHPVGAENQPISIRGPLGMGGVNLGISGWCGG